LYVPARDLLDARGIGTRGAIVESDGRPDSAAVSAERPEAVRIGATRFRCWAVRSARGRGPSRVFLIAKQFYAALGGHSETAADAEPTSSAASAGGGSCGCPANRL